MAFAAPRTLTTIVFLILPIVRWEPAPADVLFALLIVVSFAGLRPRSTVPITVAVPLTILVAITLLSMINAVEPAPAVRFAFITLYLIALAIWLTRIFQDPTATQLVMRAFLIGATVSAVIAVFAVLVGFPGSDTFVWEGARARVLFKDPNVLAPYLVPAALIMLEDMIKPRLLGWRFATKLVMLLFLFGGVLVAYSRGGWLNLLVGLAVVILVYAWRRNGFGSALQASLVLGMAAVAGVVLLKLTGSLAFLEERSHFQAYDVDRFSNQSSAFGRMTEFVFGHGPGQADADLALSAHSLYVRLAFEQGVIGFVLGIVLTVVTLWFALVLVVRNVDVWGVGSAALLATWIGVSVNGVFVDTIHWRHLWVFAALIWAGYWRTLRSPRSEEGDRPALRTAPKTT